MTYWLRINCDEFELEPSWKLADSYVKVNNAACDDLNSFIKQLNTKWNMVGIDSNKEDIYSLYINEYYEKVKEVYSKHAELLGLNISPSGAFQVEFRVNDYGPFALIYNIKSNQDLLKVINIYIKDDV